MDKKEFLSIMREALSGEVNRDIIEQNIQYYDHYISSQNASEMKVIQALGDPRLIARTIIETDKMSRQKDGYTGYHAYTDDYYDRARESREDENNRRKSGIFKMFNLRWYHRVLFAVVIILFLIALVYIAKVIITFLIVFAVPVIVLLLVASMFRKRL